MGIQEVKVLPTPVMAVERTTRAVLPQNARQTSICHMPNAKFFSAAFCLIPLKVGVGVVPVEEG